MFLYRLGSKKRMAKDLIQNYFPQHSIFIEPFFGAGGLFFNKPKVKYNIVNDLDSDVFNFYLVLKNKKDEFYKELYNTPIHSDLLKYYKNTVIQNDVERAVRFLALSNFTYLGKTDVLKTSISNVKQIALDLIDRTHELIFDVVFNNNDFEVFLKNISFRSSLVKANTFIYCDPPYLGTANNYSNSFTEADCIRLFDCLENMDCKFAVSEFDNDFIIEQAKQRNLKVFFLNERQNLKNRRNEILVTNYEPPLKLF